MVPASATAILPCAYLTLLFSPHEAANHPQNAACFFSCYSLLMLFLPPGMPFSSFNVYLSHPSNSVQISSPPYRSLESWTKVIIWFLLICVLIDFYVWLSWRISQIHIELNWNGKRSDCSTYINCLVWHPQIYLRQGFVCKWFIWEAQKLLIQSVEVRQGEGKEADNVVS